MKRQALSIGVDVATSFGYARRLRPLHAAVTDAHALGRLAVERMFATVVLTDEQATVANVRRAIAETAALLDAGDTFLLAFNGHGLAADTPSGFQQSWCLFDRALLRFGAQGLDAQLALFREGVRVLIVANCCHSGVDSARTPLTPAIRAHVVRISACAAAGIAQDRPDASRPSPFAKCFLDAARGRAHGGIFALFDRIAKTSAARPQLEIGEPRSEEFLRNGF